MDKIDLTYASKGLDPKIIAVHDGRFHVDDVFAAMLMRAIYPKAKIIRTRDAEALNKADIVIDVGAIYDPKQLRFDHHQEGKAGRRENGIEFSGLGLVWNNWGMEICHGNRELYDELDISLIQPIDADDNGQAMTAGSVQCFEDVKEVSLGALIASHNPPSPKSLKDYDDSFEAAMDFAEIVFKNFLATKTSLLNERGAIVDGWRAQDDRRYVLDEEYRPVLRHSKHMPELLFYIFPRESGGSWLMKSAHESNMTNEQRNRKLMPKEWAGKSGKDLEEVSGIKGMLFCHNNLFICGAETKEAILEALEASMAA